MTQCTAPYRRERRELRYLEPARQNAVAFDVPLAMVLAVMRTESDFRPDAVSRAGACGLMQLMPETFAFLQKEKFNEALPDNAIFDPAVNIRYGTYYLSYLYTRFDSWQIALAAYNAGEGRVAEWLKEDAALSHIPFPETAHYVESTLKAFAAYRDKYQ
ncbi:MAG: lytic transglycosylase domain-containing protein [Clostridia bacterium]|nr:lytic transglycosylase domain-containing protein [Clostridia bacterium]